MKKLWRMPRQVIVHQALPEKEDTQRFERLVELLSSGLERQLSASKRDTSQCVDFRPDILLNTYDNSNTRRDI
jgi:hypothetical protein